MFQNAGAKTLSPADTVKKFLFPVGQKGIT